MKISEIASEKIAKLPVDKQQQVLDFIEFIQSKIEPETIDENVSFLEAAKDFAGCLDNKITDLSHNQQYMEGYGE
ncbi:DUF2281 domain-containing protein [Crocosphaera sp.]|uniref:DUF2281 domain-containing protein n=1 Tax=Crocosphaera sp. TaxID=2729996 RepID=UPI003F280A53|nr:hypothetical protein [Crocosphaera sp.]